MKKEKVKSNQPVVSDKGVGDINLSGMKCPRCGLDLVTQSEITQKDFSTIVICCSNSIHNVKRDKRKKKLCDYVYTTTITR